MSVPTTLCFYEQSKFWNHPEILYQIDKNCPQNCELIVNFSSLVVVHFVRIQYLDLYRNEMHYV